MCYANILEQSVLSRESKSPRSGSRPGMELHVGQCEGKESKATGSELEDVENMSSLWVLEKLWLSL